MEPADVPTPLTDSDRVLLLAVHAWGDDPGAGLWDVFPPDRGAALRWAWEHGPTRALSRVDALTELASERHAQARVDLARVHVSWWARALRDEPLSVRL